MKQLIPFTFLLLSIAAFDGCKKEDDKIGRAYMLINGGWQITAVTSNGANALTTCLNDNTFYFYSDRTASADLGATRCTPNDGVLSGYSFANDENTLNWTYTNANPDVWTVKSAS